MVIFGKKRVTCNLFVTSQSVGMSSFLLTKLQLQYIYKFILVYLFNLLIHTNLIDLYRGIGPPLCNVTFNQKIGLNRWYD